MKKISIFLILLLILQVNAVYAKTDTVKVIVNYNLIKYNKKTGFPSKKNVPFKQTMKSIGCSIGYDKKKKVAIAIYDNTRLEFPLNKKYFYNNNRKIGYSCAMKSHFRKSGNQMSGKWKSSSASLLA